MHAPTAPRLHAVTRLVGTCEPRDIIANRMDPWHGSWFHPYSFTRLEVLTHPPVDEDVPDEFDRFLVAVTFRIGRLGIPVVAEFTSPEPRTIVMRIVDGEGSGSVVETHATPVGRGPDGLPRTAVLEAVIAHSDRPGFMYALRGARADHTVHAASSDATMARRPPVRRTTVRTPKSPLNRSASTANGYSTVVGKQSASGNISESAWRYSLTNWGHDPCKWKRPAARICSTAHGLITQGRPADLSYVPPRDPSVVHDLIRRRSHRIVGAGAEDRADLVLDCAVGGDRTVSEVGQHTHGFVDRQTEFLPATAVHRIDGSLARRGVTAERVGPHAGPCPLLQGSSGQQHAAITVEEITRESQM